LDAFIAAMLAIAKESEETPEIVTGAPHTTVVGRLDEARAARSPDLRWWPRQPKVLEEEPAPPPDESLGV
jgi:glycine dehydrogenase subunit 2